MAVAYANLAMEVIENAERSRLGYASTLGLRAVGDAGRISIRPLDDLFEPTVEREQSVHRATLPTSLSPDRLKPFPDHPFKVREDEELIKLAESIKENGVPEPILCRPDGTGDDYRNVMRYIRLTELSPQLLELVDSGKLKFHPAVELSSLKPAEQDIVYMAIWDSRKYPSLTQAKNLKQLSQNGRFDADTAMNILQGDKIQPRHVSFKRDELRDFFPGNYSAEQIKDATLNILEVRQ